MKNVISLEQILCRTDTHYIGENNFVEVGGKLYPFIKGQLGHSPRVFAYPQYADRNICYGCYVLQSWQTSDFYVGSSERVYNRVSQHKTNIRSMRCDNQNLQKLLEDGHTVQDFDLIVIFTENRESAFDLEQLLVGRHLTSGKLLNIAEDVRTSTRGTKLSPEHQQALLNANVGRVNTPESRQRIAEAIRKTHQEHPEYGQNISRIRKKSEACRSQFAEIHARKRRRISVNGKEFPSITEASIETGISSSKLISMTKEEHPSVFYLDVSVNPLKGRTLSEETKRKISEARKNSPAAKAQLDRARKLRKFQQR